MSREHRTRFGAPGLATIAVALAAAGCAPPDTPPRQPARPALVELGEKLFTEETFDGNGRVCSTCHEPAEFGTITPEFVRRRYEADPGDPLFRAIDSDDGLGRSYERLEQHATVRVPVEMATHVGSGLSVRMCDAPARTATVLNRGNPNVFNVALEAFLMVDGREGDDLDTQALNAVHTHAEPGREPTPDELAAIAAYQESLFSHAAVKAFAEGGEGPRLPDGVTPSERRGRAFFEPDRQCGICHSGPMLNETSPAHTNAVGFRFETDLVGMEPDNPNEKHSWCFVDPATNRIVPGPSGDTLVFAQPLSDPGLTILAGVQRVRTPEGQLDSLSNEVLAVLAGGPPFKIPTLWGIPETAPYFHDNSAETLEDVLDQYNFMFGILTDFAGPAGCDPDRPVCLSERDKQDIIAYLQLLSFEGRGIGVTTLAQRGR